MAEEAVEPTTTEEEVEQEVQEVHEVHEPQTHDWQAEARKSQRWAKKEREQREALEQKLRDREEMDKSEFEKAVEAARQEGEKTVRSEVDKERRADRLESAVIKAAAKGFKVKDSDGNETVVKFADPDDAQTYIERALRRGDLDEEDIFDDKGKINSTQLIEALGALLESKPHLIAGEKKPHLGRVDGGKGSPPRDAEEFTPDQWFGKIHKNKAA